MPKRQLLLEARRYARHVLKKLQKVQEESTEFDISLDETTALANRMITWLDELIKTEERKDD